MSDIFREVDEALQKEKADQFWKSYGPTLVLAAIVMIAASGLTSAYIAWNTWENNKETAKLVAASEDKDIAAAMEKAAADTRSGHKAVALIIAANQYAGKKDFAKAATTYGTVADEGSAPDDLRDLAVILQTRAILLIPENKTPEYKALAEGLENIARNDKSAFHFHAALDGALLYGDGLKDYTKALELLKSFDTDGAPDSLKEKAAALKNVYGYEASQNGKQ